MAGTAAGLHLHRGIWYMGAKGRVIPDFLARVLEEELGPGETVVDLMSGSGVVSAYCADRFRVFANDVQLYSAIITKSLIEHSPGTKEAFIAALDPLADLGEAYRENLDALKRYYRPALEEEARLLKWFEGAGGRRAAGNGRLSRERGAGLWAREYREFLENAAGTYPGGSEPAGREFYRRAAGLISERSIRGRRRNPRARPAFLVTAYYANVYYGLRQALEIDSLRVAIDALTGGPFADRKRTHYLSALLHAASVSTSGTSHFAQPRHLDKDSELVAMARRRSLDVFELFREYSEAIAETVKRTAHRKGNRAFQAEYSDLIRKGGGFAFPGTVDLVYLDPPYTADHYSRFYHVLEVIARYDYPELQRDRRGQVVRGRYPLLGERYQSDFCRPGRVEDEFRSVARASAACGAKLVVSYSYPTGLLVKQYARNGGRPLARFTDLFREAYRSVLLERRRMMHSGQGDSNLRIEELLAVCSDPR